MLRIAIRCENGAVKFDPEDVSASIGDAGGNGVNFIFENYDTNPHQPNPDDSSKFGQWCPEPIPAGTPERPAPSILNTVNSPANIGYACQLDPNLKGSINFTA